MRDEFIRISSEILDRVELVSFIEQFQKELSKEKLLTEEVIIDALVETSVKLLTNYGLH